MTISTVEDMERQPMPLGTLPRWVAIIEPVAMLAERLAETEFVPGYMRNRPAAVAAAIMWGDEAGVGPMQSLKGIQIIDGRVSPSAELVRALILRAGHEIWAEEASSNAVTMCGRRKGSNKVTTITWTLEDARRAGLAGGRAWTKYPRAMLAARASAELGRLLFPDVLAGLSDDTDDPEDAQPEEAPAEPRKRTMRRAPKRVPIDAPRAEPEPAAGVTEPDDGAEEPPRPEAPSSLEPVQDPVEEPVHDYGPLPPSPDQTRAMFAMFRDVLGDALTREQRLAFAAACVMRDIASSRDLSGRDVSTVLDTLAQIRDGHLRAEWHTQENGAPVVTFGVPA